MRLISSNIPFWRGACLLKALHMIVWIWLYLHDCVNLIISSWLCEFDYIFRYYVILMPHLNRSFGNFLKSEYSTMILHLLCEIYLHYSKKHVWIIASLKNDFSLIVNTKSIHDGFYGVLYQVYNLEIVQ